LKNSEKTIESLQSTIKSVELRFEKQKQRSDAFQNEANDNRIKLDKAQGLLSNANKIVRAKNTEVDRLKVEIANKDKIL